MTSLDTWNRKPAISKSKYLAGLQCERRIWLETHAAGLATPPDTAGQAQLDAGSEVGARAQELFPGGVLVSEPRWQHAEAVLRTATLMADPAVPAIFEAAFEFEGVRVRVDVLERIGPKRWRLCEVKASASIKAEHLDDVALQRFVLEGAGLNIDSCELIHVDTGYVRDAGEIDWRQYFLRVDCGAASDEALNRVAANLRGFRGVLGDPHVPEVEPGFHCQKPQPCPFWEHCTRDKPEDWVRHLPWLRETSFLALRDTGYEKISELPDDADITEAQLRVRDVVRSGERYVSAHLRDALAGSGPPAWYLDFETVSPALPLFAGTRPYQVIPFQWSLHHVDADGKVTHRFFLADGGGDPRREFCETLCAALWEDVAPVHVYSHFEATRLSALETELPNLAPVLGGVRARLFDQHALLREHVYDAGFAGSFSLKAVAPALIEGFGWGDLDRVADGGAAAVAWPALVRGELGEVEGARMREALLDYCERDTLALLDLHRVLGEW